MTGISPIGPQNDKEYTVSSASTSTKTESTPIDYENRGSAAQASGEEIDAAKILGFEKNESTGETTSTAPIATPRKAPAPATDEEKDYFTNVMTPDQRQELVNGVKTNLQNEIENRQEKLDQLYENDFVNANQDADYTEMSLNEYVSFAREQEDSLKKIMEELSDITNFSDVKEGYEHEAIVESILMDKDDVSSEELKKRISDELDKFSKELKTKFDETYEEMSNISKTVQNDFSTLDEMAQNGIIEHLNYPTSQYFETALGKAYNNHATGIESTSVADNPHRPDGSVKFLGSDGNVYIKKGKETYELSGRKVNLN